MKQQTFSERPLSDRRRIHDKERAKFPDCNPVVVTPRRELGEGCLQKKYSVQSHVRVMDFMRILRETYKVVSESTGLALFAEHAGKQVLLRNDELISEVYKRLTEDDGWLYLHFDIQKRFG